MEKLIVVLIVLALFGGAIAVIHRNHKREQAERRAARDAAARAGAADSPQSKSGDPEA